MTRRYTYKRIDGVVYKLPSIHKDRENSVGLSQTDMLDILHKSEGNFALKELLQKIKNVYFMTYSETAHSNGIKTIASPEIQKMTDDELYDHNIILDIAKRVQDLGW